MADDVPAAPVTVLIVEDDDLVFALIAAAVVQVGAAPLLAYDGEQRCVWLVPPCPLW